METVKKYARVLLNIIIPLFVIYMIFRFGPPLLKYFMPFVIGWLISLVANPLVRFLENRLRIVRKHSSAFIVILVLALILTGGYFIGTKIITEGMKFAKDLPGIYDLATLEINEILAKFSNLAKLLPAGMQGVLNDFGSNISSYMGEIIQKIGQPTVEIAGNFAKQIPNFLIHVLFIILSSYFFIAKRDTLMKLVHRILPKRTEEKMKTMNKQLTRLAGGYVVAQLKIMVIVAGILFVGFLILDVNYAFLLGIVIAFLDFLPLFGTGTALIPWAVIKFLSGEYTMSIGLAVIYVATQGIRQIIQPKIVGDTMGIDPLATMILLFVGYKYAGISGMILSVPFGILTMEFYKFGLFDSLIENVKILITDINNFRKGM